MAEETQDPFKDFGGKAIATQEPTTTEDPFKAFGGMAVKKKPLPSAVKSGGQPSKSGSQPSPNFPTSTSPFGIPESPVLTQAKADARLQEQAQKERAKRAVDYQSMLSDFGSKKATSRSVARDNTTIVPQVLTGRVSEEDMNKAEEQAKKESDAFEAPYKKQGYWGGVKLGAKYITSKLAQGGADLVTGAMSAGNTLAKGTNALQNLITGDNRKLDNEYFVQDLEDNISNKAKLGVPDEYEPDHVMSAVGGLARLAPSLLGGESTKGLSYFLSSTGEAQQEVNKLKNQGVKFENGSDDVYTMAKGLAGYFLMHRLNSHVILGKIPSEAASNVLSKVALQAVDGLVKSGEPLTSEAIANEVKNVSQSLSSKLLSKTNNILKKYAYTATDLAGFNFADAGAKLASNSLNKKDAFTNIGDNLEEGLKKSLSVDAPLFTIGGALFTKSPLRNTAIEALRESNTPETVDAIKQQIAQHGIDNGLSENEIQQSVDYVDNLSDAVSKLPTDMKPEAHRRAVDLLIGRKELEQEQSALTEAKTGQDEAVKDIPADNEKYLNAKIEQANDKLQSIVGKEKITYTHDKVNDKYYKNINGKAEEISKELYDLDRGERDARNEQKRQQSQQTPAVEQPATLEPIEPPTEPTEAPAIKNANTEQRAAEAGVMLEDTVGTKRGSDVVEADAQKAVDSGYDAHELVDKILNKEHQASDTEVGILTKFADAKEQRVKEISDKLSKDGANMSKAEFDELLAEQDKTTNEFQDILQAAKKTGTETARALGARRFAMQSDYSLGNMIARKRSAIGGEKLTAEQVNELTTRHAELVAAQAKYEARIKELETENTKLQAIKNIKKSASERLQRNSITKERLAKEREDIKKEFSAKLKSLRTSGAMNSVGKATAEFLVAATPYVAKMVRNLAHEGVIELTQVVSRLRDELDLHDLEERDITDMIAGKYNETKPTKQEIDGQIRSLRIQAKLVGQIEDAEKGIAKTPNPPKAKTEAVELLRKRLKEIERQGAPTKEEADLSRYKNRLNKQIEELKQKLSTGDYSKEPAAKPVPMDKEALELRREADRLKHEFDVGIQKDILAQRSKAEKIKDDVLNIASLPRALKATLDFSAVGRQGLFLSVGHPEVAGKALKEMFGQTFSQEKYDNWLSDLKHSDAYDLITKSDLYVSEKNNPELLAREEEFTSNLAERIPVFGKLVQGSERAYSAYLNAIRTGVFINESAKLIENGYTFENNPQEFKSLAKVINIMSGRGDIPEWLGGRQPAILSNALFSPRFMASRIQMLYLWADPRISKNAKILYAKDIGKTLGTVATIATLATLAGMTVERDPRSSDFLKIKDGNTRYDFLAGMAPYVVFLSQQINGNKKPTSNNGLIPLTTGKYGKPTRLTLAGNFLRGKFSPLVGTGVNLLDGKDIVGNEYTYKNIPQEFIPLPATDVKSAYDVGGITNALKVIVPATFGIGVSSYDANAKKKKSQFTIGRN